MTTLQEALDEVEKAIPKVVWLPDLTEVNRRPEALVIRFKAFTGQADGWTFLVVGVDVPEMRGVERAYSVTASKAGIIFKLPPNLAEKAGKIAESVDV